jgi:hypothetical protein
MARWRYFVLGLLVTVGLAGCVMPDGSVVVLPLTPAAPAITAPRLEAALAHAPAATEQIAFVDWMLLKEIAGVPGLTGNDSLDARMDFMISLGVESQAVTTVYGRNHFLIHAEEWGWDSTDLLWEASLTLESSPPIYLLRFRDDFDFVPVLQRFEERGFARQEHGGVPWYSHEMDLRSPWLRTTEFAILNTAFLAQEKLFVLSSTPDSLLSLLDALAKGAILSNLPSVRSLSAALGAVGSAILLPLGCQPFDVTALLDPETREDRMAELRQSSSLGLYTGLALGYRPTMQGGEILPLGVLVLHYLEPSLAAADLEPRRRLAEMGTSIATNTPYAELFQVVEASVEGSNLLLFMQAHAQPPQLFFNMFYRRDMLFAVCGG